MYHRWFQDKVKLLGWLRRFLDLEISTKIYDFKDMSDCYKSCLICQSTILVKVLSRMVNNSSEKVRGIVHHLLRGILYQETVNNCQNPKASEDINCIWNHTNLNLSCTSSNYFLNPFYFSWFIISFNYISSFLSH